MESVLHLYNLPLDEKRPAVCFDEMPVQLLGEVVAPLPMKEGHSLRFDYEYELERQSYYGAVNLLTKEFHLQACSGGNGENTATYLRSLMELYRGKKLLLLWDGATYHRDVQCQGFLAEVNQGLEEQDWLVTCLRFAQTAPESNYLCKINLSKDEFGFRIYLMSHHYSADLNRILSQFQFEADDRIRQTFAGRYEKSG